MSRSTGKEPIPPHPAGEPNPPSSPSDAIGHDEVHRFLPPSLHIGVATIDAQHANLFRRLIWLKRQCLQNNCLSADDAESLLAYLREHFATEARFAVEGKVDFSQHARRHQEMLNHVSRALHSAVAGQADVFSVLRYIEYWFERHIVQEDISLGRLDAP